MAKKKKKSSQYVWHMLSILTDELEIIEDTPVVSIRLNVISSAN